jgi:small subunit ribosomal protein S5
MADFARPKRKDMRDNRRSKNPRREQDTDGLVKKIVSIRRVTRVYKGGKRMRLSVMVVVGDQKGKVGAGIGKGADVRAAEAKAYEQAKKNMVDILLKGNTIPHPVTIKRGASLIVLKPAVPGTGVIAGSAVRTVVEVAGIKDVLGKILGTNNKISNTYATIEALASMIKR